MRSAHVYTRAHRLPALHCTSPRSVAWASSHHLVGRCLPCQVHATGVWIPVCLDRNGAEIICEDERPSQRPTGISLCSISAAGCLPLSGLCFNFYIKSQNPKTLCWHPLAPHPPVLVLVKTPPSRCCSSPKNPKTLKLEPGTRSPQVLVKATGSSIQTLLKPALQKTLPPIEKRRLYPLRHPEIFGNTIGNAAAITYCVEHQLVPYSPVRHPLALGAPSPVRLP